MTTPHPHDDTARGPAPASAPDWTGPAYDLPPADDRYQYTGPPGPPGYGPYGYPPPGRPAGPYPPANSFPYASGGVPKAPTSLAVVAAILFAPLGVWALILAGQVTAKAGAGDIVGALAAANKARTVSYAGIAVGALIIVLFCASAWSAMTDPYYGTY